MLTLDCENSCRICLIESDKLGSIFDDQDDRKINEILEEIAGINISADDKLSKKICEDCKLKAVELSEFRQLCIDSDETVRYNIILDEQEDAMSTFEEEEALESDSEIIEETEGEVFHLDEEESYLDEDPELNEGSEKYEIYQIEDMDDDDDETMSEIKATISQNKVILVEEDDSNDPKALNYQYDSLDDLTQQMRAAHYAKEQLKKHKCPYCDKSFLFPSKVNRHVLAVHKDLKQPKKNIKKNHYCHICGKAFVSKFKVRRHMVVHDTELKTGLQKNWTRNYLLCQQCMRKFHTKVTYDRHTIICEMLMKSEIQRADDYEYTCVICSQTFKHHDEMVDHLKKMHNLEPETEVQCQLCRAYSGNVTDIVRHGRYHEENATYKCSECQKFFPNGDEIISHLLRHANYKPFECTHDNCDKRFFDRYKLRTHMISHDPNIEKKFVCEECQRPFTHLDYLNCHIRRKHSTVKPYSCTFCAKSFAFNHDLNLHMTVHTGNKKHICATCDASFTKAWSLKQHMALHEENPSPFQCALCNFSAPTKSQLNKHLSTHDQQQIAYLCEECNVGYKTEDDLKSHMEEIHQNQYTYIDASSDPYSLVEIPSSY